MSTYITIDGGTSSTRASLVCDCEIIKTVKLDIGARASIENREKYTGAIKAAIDEIISIRKDTPKRILASGMITCEFGLCNLPHLEAPAGIYELHESMHETVISEISDIPFVFMRGVRVNSDDFDKVDMMRGEETEIMGILKEEYGECIYILPGSHSKIIKVDENGRIAEFSTMLTGEMIASLSQGTILKDAVDLGNSKINDEYLLKGYDYAKEAGINKALFKVRILKNIFGCSNDEVYSFFMGAVLSDEIYYILKDGAESIVLGGKSQIKKAMAIILNKKSDKRIIELDEKAVDYSTSLGMIRIYEYCAN
ncbi:MAG: hypothetical protein E7415_07140 [Ruminococcaceae bacterium]|nr:hypothetical protein [Oscillospiraceae bacterium]